MTKLWVYLIPLFLSMIACGVLSKPAPHMTDMGAATLTATAQNNQPIATQQTMVTPTKLTTQPILMQPTTTEQKSFHLSLDILRNSWYYSPDWGEFQLLDGVYYRTPPTSQESPEIYTTRLLDTIIYGDINLDGWEDAVVFLTTQNGGTGHFVEMSAVLNLDGNARNISTLYLGDRIVVETGEIQNGLITLNLRVQGPNDGACCPSQNETRIYRLDGSQLVQIP